MEVVRCGVKAETDEWSFGVLKGTWTCCILALSNSPLQRLVLMISRQDSAAVPKKLSREDIACHQTSVTYLAFTIPRFELILIFA